MSEETLDLEQRLFQLETLYEIGREAASLSSVPDVLRVMLSMLMGAYGATRGLAFAGTADGRLEAVHARGLAGEGQFSAESLARGYLLGGGGGDWLASAGLEVCLPLTLDDATRGAIALGPRLSGVPYADADRALLGTIVANAAPYLHNVKLLAALRDSAHDLERKVRALAVVNEIALGITTRPSARRLHRFLLERVAGALDADTAALRLRADEGFVVAAEYHAAPPAGAFPRASAPPTLPTHEHEMIVPVRYGDEATGAVWLRRAPTAPAFDADDRSLAELLANQVAVILETSRLFEGFLEQQQEQFRLRGMLEQYLATSVAERLISGETRPTLEGTRLPVSVLMVDMRGSTELINHVEPEVMVRLLNQYLGQMTDVLFHYEGTIDKFAGDAVLGFFGAPEGHADDPLRAVCAAAAMQRAFAGLLLDWRRRYPTLPGSLGIGIGIATGDVVVGNIGSAKRLEHTVIGPAVNLAARLTAKAPHGTIHIDDSTWNAVAGPLGFTARARPRRPRYVRAKGFAALVPVYRLHAADVPATL
jgi:class 3 adenylate cyclase